MFIFLRIYFLNAFLIKFLFAEPLCNETHFENSPCLEVCSQLLSCDRAKTYSCCMNYTLSTVHDISSKPVSFSQEKTTPTNQVLVSSDESEAGNIGSIVGGIVAGVIILAIIVIIVVCIRKKKSNRDNNPHGNEEEQVKLDNVDNKYCDSLYVQNETKTDSPEDNNEVPTTSQPTDFRNRSVYFYDPSRDSLIEKERLKYAENCKEETPESDDFRNRSVYFYDPSRDSLIEKERLKYAGNCQEDRPENQDFSSIGKQSCEDFLPGLHHQPPEDPFMSMAYRPGTPINKLGDDDRLVTDNSYECGSSMEIVAPDQSSPKSDEKSPSAEIVAPGESTPKSDEKVVDVVRDEIEETDSLLLSTPDQVPEALELDDPKETKVDKAYDAEKFAKSYKYHKATGKKSSRKK